MLYEYVPLVSWNAMYDLFELWMLPDRLTDQSVLEGSPDSVKFSEYLGMGRNVIASVMFAPFTVAVPDEGLTV
jgi:hypothetical protein